MAKHTFKAMVAGAAATLLVTFAAPAMAGNNTPSAPGLTGKKISLLYSLTADSALLRPVRGTKHVYSLRLNGVDQHTIWFSDRPARSSGIWTTQLFVKAWDKGATFHTDPPNVAMVLHTPRAGTDTVVAVMRQPVYWPKTDRLTARLHVLTEEEADSITGGLHYHAQRHDGTDVPRRVDEVSLFIDSGNVSLTKLWVTSFFMPDGVFRIYWKDGTMWKCIPGVTANWQSVFSGASIERYQVYGPRSYRDGTNLTAWEVCEHDRDGDGNPDFGP